MKENLLHFIWRLRLYPSNKFKGTNNEYIELISPGEQNFNAGPDFLNAKIRINDQLWAGNVEIHVDAADWYVHHHEIDTSYDSVILHVVWDASVVVFRKNNEPIPTLSLRDYIPEQLLNSYKKLMNVKRNWINCEKEIATLHKFSWIHWTDRLFYERIEQKLPYFENILDRTKMDWEATLFISLARNFGLKINQEEFHKMASSLDFSMIRKVCKNRFQLEALLFGQAGLLATEFEENYCRSLRKEFEFLKAKFDIPQNSSIQMQFFRLRPSGFPTIRISQLAGLYNRHLQLFSKMLEIDKLEEYYILFEGKTSEYWETHYTFETPSKKRIKRISKPLIHSIILNTLIPLKFLYLKRKGIYNEPREVDLAQQLPIEKNSTISNFINIGVLCSSAFESQALLQLKKEYCDKQRCLNCEVGTALLVR